MSTLARKHRPKKLEDVVGNEAVVESIRSLFKRDKENIPHAFLFHGPRGCGKTTMGRIVGNLLGCPEEEIQEYNTANLRGIETVRDIAEKCPYATLSGNIRVYILDEVHRQTKDAQNALLKLLEEPPEDVYFILCTTEPESLLPTVSGRCHSYLMKSLKPTEMTTLIDRILEKEKFNSKEYPTTIKKEIYRLAEGLPRNALILLDSVIDMDDEDLIIASLSNVDLTEVNGKEVFQALLNRDNWDKIRKQVKALLTDNEPEKVRRALLGYMEAVLYNSKANNRASEIIEEFKVNTYDSGRAGLTNMFYFLCQK
jgi:DNA polymerase-3 subunit gamma/tau